MFNQSAMTYIARAPLGRDSIKEDVMKTGRWVLLAGLLLNASAMAAMDINSATQSELETIKGIGPAKAKVIVEYRQKNGPFKNLNALAGVKGFGKASVAKIKHELTVGPAPIQTRPAGKK
jgi:competence protein ComEA